MQFFRRTPERDAAPTRPLTRPLSLPALRLLFALSALCLHAAPLPAQPQGGDPAAAQPVTQAQADLYERWRSNVNLNQQAAFDAGREYLTKYPADGYAAYVRPWVATYEREARNLDFARLYKARRFAEVFRVGRDILAAEPDHLKTIFHLAYAGYLAAGSGDDSHGTDALAHARRAVELIEAGARPADWQPFAGRADALGYLNFISGELTLKTDPDAAALLFRKAVGFEGSVRQSPVIYSRLAAAYVAARYDPLSKDYQSRFAGREATGESKAALEKINSVVDLIIDAYARSVALSGSDPKYAAARPRWVEELTRLYKFRHNDSADGLEAFVAGVAAKPLPE